MWTRHILFFILPYAWSFKSEIEAVQLNSTIDNASTDNIALNNDDLNGIELVIPDECKRLDFCENMDNYPQEYVSKIIDMLSKNNIHLHADVAPGEDLMLYKYEKSEDSTELCISNKLLIHPLAARDRHNNWYLVLNSKDIPQNYIGVVCRGHPSEPESCSGEVFFPPSMYGVCIQQYIYRKAYVYDLSTMTVKAILIPIPSCCSCQVVRTTGFNESDNKNK